MSDLQLGTVPRTPNGPGTKADGPRTKADGRGTGLFKDVAKPATHDVQQSFGRLVRELRRSTRSINARVSERAALVLLVFQWGLAAAHLTSPKPAVFMARAVRSGDLLLRCVHGLSSGGTPGASSADKRGAIDARGAASDRVQGALSDEYPYLAPYPSLTSLFPNPGDLERGVRRASTRTVVETWPEIKAATWRAVRAGFVALTSPSLDPAFGASYGPLDPWCARQQDCVAWAGQLAKAFVSCTDAARVLPQPRNGRHVDTERGMAVRKMFYCSYTRLKRAWYAWTKRRPT
jgi:hypothetical protein